VRFAFNLIFRANWLHAVGPLIFLWLGLIFWGQGTTDLEEWGTVIFALLVGVFIICMTNFADMYSDRSDRIHRPDNPMVTGDITIKSGRNLFIAENIIGLLLLIILYFVTHKYLLILALAAGWIGGLMYSLPPFRLKGRKIIGPFEFGLCCAIIPLVGWLIVKPPDAFIAAFALVLFVGGSVAGVTTKLRRTAENFNAGVLSGSNTFALKTTDFGILVKNALIIEAILLIGAIGLILLFSFLGVFKQTLALYLVLSCLPLILIGLTIRGKNPISNLKRAELSFILICATLPVIAIATFISSIVYIA